LLLALIEEGGVTLSIFIHIALDGGLLNDFLLQQLTFVYGATFDPNLRHRSSA